MKKIELNLNNSSNGINTYTDTLKKILEYAYNLNKYTLSCETTIQNDIFYYNIDIIIEAEDINALMGLIEALGMVTSGSLKIADYNQYLNDIDYKDLEKILLN